VSYAKITNSGLDKKYSWVYEPIYAGQGEAESHARISKT
jgi:hypothetical protein